MMPGSVRIHGLTVQNNALTEDELPPPNSGYYKQRNTCGEIRRTLNEFNAH